MQHWLWIQLSHSCYTSIKIVYVDNTAIRELFMQLKIITNKVLSTHCKLSISQYLLFGNTFFIASKSSTYTA